MHIYCRTPRAILLLGISDESGVKRFPCDPSGTLPGLSFIPRPLEAINVQLIEFARSLVDGELADLDVIQNFSDATVDGEEATVYLATGIADACALSRRT